MDVQDLRHALTGLVTPLTAFFVAGWIAQYAGFSPPLYPSALPVVSIHGYRLQGLTAHPNSLGWASALALVIAVAARPSAMVWLGRLVSAFTLLGTDSRTSIVVAGVGLAMVWILGPRRHPAARWVSATGLVVAGVYVWQMVIDIRRTTSHDVLTNRDVIWRQLFPYLHHLPLFGYGPDFLQGLRVQLFGYWVPPSFYVDAQNQWLSDALQYGYPVAVMTTLFLVAVATRGPLSMRRVILLPMVAMVFAECFSEVPISLWASTEAAFPLFLILCCTPVAAALGRPPARDGRVVDPPSVWTEADVR